MRTLLTLTLLLMAPVQIVAPAGGSPPEVAGYRLGADWQKIGRLMPCQSGPDGLSGAQKTEATLYYAQLIAELRICDPSDLVHLYFFRDTLFRIRIAFHFSLRSGPTETWNQQRDWAVETLGEPDSVIARSIGGADWVVAHWDRTRSQWQAELTNYANGLSFLDMAYCEFLPAVCEAIFHRSLGLR
jgi:hypothetical protein